MSWKTIPADDQFAIAELILAGILPIILICIGTIGNILCIICLFFQRHGRRSSTNVYLIFLWIMDTLSLYQWNLDYAVMIFGNNVKMSEKALFLCRSVTFLSFYTLHSSALFLSIVAIDRALLLWSRNYKLKMGNYRQAFLFSIITLIGLFVLDGFTLSIGYIDQSTNKISCNYQTNSSHHNFYLNIYPWIHLVVMYIIPFALMIIGGILIIIKLRSRLTLPLHFNQNHRFSLTLIGMCIIYIILTLPNRLIFSVFLSSIANHNYTQTVIYASNTLLYTRNATNILISYVGRAKFRKQISRLFCHCRCCLRRHNRIQPLQRVPIMTTTQLRHGGSS